MIREFIRNSLAILTIGLLVFSVSGHVFAQLPSSAGSYDVNIGAQDPITVSVFPNQPQQGQSVTVSIDAFSTDLDRAKVRWSVNGKTVLSGTGEKSYTFTAGDPGQASTVGIFITTVEGQTYSEQTVVKTSQQVDLVWEAHSYVPPFYQGKAMFPYQGQVTIEAIPNFIEGGRRLDPKTLVYTWSSSGKAIGEGSGFGKNSIELQSAGINVKPLAISVSVSNISKTIGGNASITIPTQSPQSVIYEDNPLFGILYNRALAENFNLNKSEIVFHAAPYFFTTPTIYTTSGVNFQWGINGSSVVPQQKAPNEILLRVPDKTSGTSQVTAKITSSSNLLQYDTRSILVNYSNSSQ